MLNLPVFLIIILSVAVSLRGLGDTRNIVRYDVGASLMVLVWLVPQMLAIESGAAPSYFPTEVTYWYILLCLVALNLGFLCGRRYKADRARASVVPITAYDNERLSYAIAGIGLLGLVAVFLMVIEAQEVGVQEQWSGVITFYFLLSQILIIAGAMGLIHYLYSGGKVGLVVYLVFLAAAVPIAVMLVRRSVLFELAVVSLGAMIFVRQFRAPRMAIIGSAIVGTMILNGAGGIRQHVFQEEGTLLSALSDEEVVSGQIMVADNQAAELRSAIADVELARQTGHYQPFANLWNLTVSQYVPSFIVGQDVKRSLFVEMQDGARYRDFQMAGATRTGFAEAFSGYWYFGLIFFFLIPFVFGRLWLKARAGDLRSQVLYLVFLLYGLLIITESLSRLVVTAPIFWAVIQCVLLFGRKQRAALRLKRA